MCQQPNGGGYLAVSVLLSILSVVRLLVIADRLGATQFNVYRYVADSNVLFAVTTAVTSFMFFKGLKMKYYKWINVIASTTFGVLLIHANSDTMRQWLWKDTLHNADVYYTDYACLYSVVAVLVVFIVCSVIDFVRINTIEKWMFKELDKVFQRHLIFKGMTWKKI